MIRSSQKVFFGKSDLIWPPIQNLKIEIVQYFVNHRPFDNCRARNVKIWKSQCFCFQLPGHDSEIAAAFCSLQSPPHWQFHLCLLPFAIGRHIN